MSEQFALPEAGADPVWLYPPEEVQDGPPPPPCAVNVIANDWEFPRSAKKNAAHAAARSLYLRIISADAKAPANRFRDFMMYAPEASRPLHITHRLSIWAKTNGPCRDAPGRQPSPRDKFCVNRLQHVKVVKAFIAIQNVFLCHVYTLTNVRFGSIADMCGAKRHVRFVPIAGHYDYSIAPVGAKFSGRCCLRRHRRK